MTQPDDSQAPVDSAAHEPDAGPILGTRRTSLAWLAGVAALAGVIGWALHLSEGRQFVRVAEQAQPQLLTVAVLLQALTYLAEAQVWRAVAVKARFALPLATAYRLSLTKLFVDQALPSVGISGTILAVSALQQRGMPRSAVMAGAVIQSASYHLIYVLCLAIALATAVVHHEVNPLLVAAAAAFGLFALGFTAVIVALAGRRHGGWHKRAKDLPLVGRLVVLLEAADSALVRDSGLLMGALLCHAGIFALDAATLWVLVQALGATAAPLGVFASFMLASLFRTLGIVPGGLGTFEAASVLALRAIGVDLTVALAATLLFRGFTFWLPMVPGLWWTRRLARSGRDVPRVTPINAYWTHDGDVLLRRLHSSHEGLAADQAMLRQAVYGRNELREDLRPSHLRALWNQVRSPLLLLLVIAAVISAVTGAWTDAVIVMAIVVATVVVGYRREYSAQSAAVALRQRVKARTTVLRGGHPVSVGNEELVPGDVVLLSAGSLVPADGVILAATDFYVSEAALTGESFPVLKSAATSELRTPIGKRSGCVFMGTNVRSGKAQCLVVATGIRTQFGAIAQRLATRAPETEFDRGLRRFGYLLTSAMLVMVFLVFVAHMLQGRPPVETLLFAIALAVGLSPELLPAILGVSLSRGASMMARQGVLVRRLNAIENLGSMDVLCTDKTGTLTAGVVQLDDAYDPAGVPSRRVLEFAAINAALETGLPSPLDDAILRAHPVAPEVVAKYGEIPFDFIRKRVSVIVGDGAEIRLIAKGAFAQVLEACTCLGDGSTLDSAVRAALQDRFAQWSETGMRVLAVASRLVPDQPRYTREDETQLAFCGFVTFVDRPKDGVAEALAGLAALGVAVKVISGDNKLVTQHVAQQVGIVGGQTLTGQQIDLLPDEALWRVAGQTTLFAEVDPNQKERIILALKKTGHVVGFLGDGVNDAPAMHAADTSLSVDQAVDVAREAADFVLLQRDLDVIRRGVEEGRRVFANTLKYVQTTTSANLGNMVSMALASLFLPFLPLLAGQILLNNFLSDFPALGIAGDSVDVEAVAQPRRWDIRFIGRFMVEFGLLSSLFDLLTFGLLLGLFHAGPELFRTGWFVESLLSELLIALVVRTRRPFFRSRPGRLLLYLTQVLVAVTFAIPFVPYARLFGLVPLPLSLMLTLSAVGLAYVGAAEALKVWFYRRVEV